MLSGIRFGVQDRKAIAPIVPRIAAVTDFNNSRCTRSRLSCSATVFGSRHQQPRSRSQPGQHIGVVPHACPSHQINTAATIPTQPGELRVTRDHDVTVSDRTGRPRSASRAVSYEQPDHSTGAALVAPPGVRYSQVTSSNLSSISGPNGITVVDRISPVAALQSATSVKSRSSNVTGSPSH